MKDIIFIFFLLILLISFYFQNKNIFNNKQNFLMVEKERDDIFDYLEYFTNFLNKNNITYWIIGGTTLGSIRHNNIVPWDDDADIGISEDDLQKLLELNQELDKDGFEIIYYWKIFKFRKIGSEYPFIDIFCYKKENDKYIMHRQDLRDVWPNEYYEENELFPLKKYKFGRLELLGPNYPLDYLDRLYPNWRHIGKHIYDHKDNKTTNITVELDYNNKEQNLKPLLYIKKDDNIRDIYNEYYNEKIISIEN
jgi:phosphorylcholine metabolism protein LicD